MWKKRTLGESVQTKIHQRPKVKKFTEEEMEDRNETSSKSDESIHHRKEIKEIEEKSKHYTAIVKVNGIEKEFIIDTGSPLTIMPPDEKILKSTGIHKLTNRYQDVNKNEVKSRGKIPVYLEYENNKQKMEILITERTDKTPLLEMD